MAEYEYEYEKTGIAIESSIYLLVISQEYLLLQSGEVTCTLQAFPTARVLGENPPFNTTRFD